MTECVCARVHTHTHTHTHTKSNDWCPSKRKEEIWDVDIETQREEGQGKISRDWSETLQVREHQVQRAAPRSPERGMKQTLPSTTRRNQHCWHLDFGLQDSSTVTEYISVVLSHPDWCWSWSSNPLATWCKEPPHWKRPWCWERLGTGEKGGNQWWDCWMASPTQWTWIWANSGMQWRTGKPEVHGITKSQAPLSNWTTTDCGTFFMTALRN